MLPCHSPSRNASLHRSRRASYFNGESAGKDIRESLAFIEVLWGNSESRKGKGMDHEGHEGSRRKILRDRTCFSWRIGARLFPIRSVDEAFDSVFQVDHVEVDEETERSAAEFEVGDDLRLMDRANCVHRLDFYDDEVLNEEVHTISDFELYAVINDEKPNLTYGPDARFPELVMQAGLVGAFQQAGAQLGMDFHRRRNDLVADFMCG